MEIFKIHHIKNDKIYIKNEEVVNEIPLTIIVNNKEILTLLASPIDLKNLSIGFLFTSGFIKNKDDIKNIVIDKKKWISNITSNNDIKVDKFFKKRLSASGYNKATIFYNQTDILHRKKNTSNFKINYIDIKSLLKVFNKKSKIYLKTGGVHSSAITDTKKILIFKEDIGRHNAIDKVIGSALLSDFKFNDKAILTSCRISSEIIYKIQKCGIPVIISKSAPTDQAIILAKKFRITLIGFARGDRMNIYTENQRVII